MQTIFKSLGAANVQQNVPANGDFVMIQSMRGTVAKVTAVNGGVTETVLIPANFPIRFDASFTNLQIASDVANDTIELLTGKGWLWPFGNSSARSFFSSTITPVSGSALIPTQGATSVDIVLASTSGPAINITRSLDNSTFEAAPLTATREDAMRFNGGLPNQLGQVGVKMRFDVTGCKYFLLTNTTAGTTKVNYALNYNVAEFEEPYWTGDDFTLAGIVGNVSEIDSSVIYTPRRAKGVIVWMDFTLTTGTATAGVQFGIKMVNAKNTADVLGLANMTTNGAPHQVKAVLISKDVIGTAATPTLQYANYFNDQLAKAFIVTATNQDNNTAFNCHIYLEWIY